MLYQVAGERKHCNAGNVVHTKTIAHQFIYVLQCLYYRPMDLSTIKKNIETGVCIQFKIPLHKSTEILNSVPV